MLVPWTPLAPSRREQALRRTALVGVLLAGGVAALAALQAVDTAWLPALLAVAAPAFALAAARRPARPALEVAVDGDGRLAVRRADRADGHPEQGLHCVFAARWLITLRAGTMLIAVWPDAVPDPIFRRLWVHVRWNPGRDRANPRDGRETRHT